MPHQHRPTYLEIQITVARNLLGEGQACYDEGKYSEAIRHYQQITEVLKKIPVGLVILGENQEKVFLLLKTAWGWMGTAFLELGMESKAQECFKKELYYNNICAKTSEKRQRIMQGQSMAVKRILLFSFIIYGVLGVCFLILPSLMIPLNLIVTTGYTVCFFVLPLAKYNPKKLYTKYREILISLRKDIQPLFYFVLGSFAAGHFALYYLFFPDILFRNDAFSLGMVFFFIFWVFMTLLILIFVTYSGDHYDPRELI